MPKYTAAHVHSAIQVACAIRAYMHRKRLEVGAPPTLFHTSAAGGLSCAVPLGLRPLVLLRGTCLYFEHLLRATGDSPSLQSTRLVTAQPLWHLEQLRSQLPGNIYGVHGLEDKAEVERAEQELQHEILQRRHSKHLKEADLLEGLPEGDEEGSPVGGTSGAGSSPQRAGRGRATSGGGSGGTGGSSAGGASSDMGGHGRGNGRAYGRGGRSTGPGSSDTHPGGTSVGSSDLTLSLPRSGVGSYGPPSPSRNSSVAAMHDNPISPLGEDEEYLEDDVPHAAAPAHVAVQRSDSSLRRERMARIRFQRENSL